MSSVLPHPHPQIVYTYSLNPPQQGNMIFLLLGHGIVHSYIFFILQVMANMAMWWQMVSITVEQFHKLVATRRMHSRKQFP